MFITLTEVWDDLEGSHSRKIDVIASAIVVLARDDEFTNTTMVRLNISPPDCIYRVFQTPEQIKALIWKAMDIGRFTLTGGE